MSPKVHGSGPSVERVRQLQITSAALMGSCVVAKQAQGLALCLERLQGLGAQSFGVDVFTIRGVTAMWDEAAQKTRGMRVGLESLGDCDKTPSAKVSKGPHLSEVFVIGHGVRLQTLGAGRNH